MIRSALFAISCLCIGIGVGAISGDTSVFAAQGYQKTPYIPGCKYYRGKFTCPRRAIRVYRMTRNRVYITPR